LIHPQINGITLNFAILIPATTGLDKTKFS
jgi:hypothetical protein